MCSSDLQQVLRPSRLGLLYCMLCCAMAAFLLGFQVHEKSILLPLLPASLLATQEPELVRVLAPLGAFSMYPLLRFERLGGAAYAAALCAGVLVVGESGIFTVDDVRLLKGVGVGALLVGESIVKQRDPRAGVRALYGRTDLEDECAANPSAEECRVYE